MNGEGEACNDHALMNIPLSADDQDHLIDGHAISRMRHQICVKRTKVYSKSVCIPAILKAQISSFWRYSCWSIYENPIGYRLPD
jgi:hypothetical protein